MLSLNQQIFFPHSFPSLHFVVYYFLLAEFSTRNAQQQIWLGSSSVSVSTLLLADILVREWWDAVTNLFDMLNEKSSEAFYRICRFIADNTKAFF